MGRGRAFNEKNQHHEHRQPKQEEPLMVKPDAPKGGRPKYIRKQEG